MKGLFTAIGRLFSATEADRNVGYYQYQMNHIPKEYGLCSDRNCPCPETVIPKGTGYLYISPDAVTFMKMMMAGNENNFTTGPMPVLVCKEGA